MIPVPALYAVIAVFVAFASGAGLGGWKGHQWGKAEIQQAWDREHAALAEQHAKAQTAAREKEQQLQAAADQLRQEKDREIRQVNARAAALADRVRHRPERAAHSSALPGTASPGPSGPRCTGAELPREDAEFLAGESARAEQLRAALAQCYAHYDQVRKISP